MSSMAKLAAGVRFPSIPFSVVGGGQIDPAELSGWRLVIVYRGKHCPLCKQYFKTLQAMLDEFKAAEISVLAVSADPNEKAEADVASEGWSFPVGYGLTFEQMRALGLYISEPRSAQETDRPFAEPGIFAINPEGFVQIIDVSNAPFSRPELGGLLRGMKFIRERNYPIRGTVA